MDQKKKLVFGAIAAVVVVVVVVVVAWPRIKSAQADCRPLKDKPEIRTIDFKNIASEDKTLLANMAGYVELKDKDNGGYLPVAVDNVDVSLQADQSFLVTLASKCVTMQIHYIKSTDNATKLYQYNSIEMFVKNDAKNDQKPVPICDFDKEFKFVKHTETRYSCKEHQTHSCSTKKDSKQVPVADLVLESFELELDADKKKAEQGLFSKEPWVSSCKAW